MTRTVASAPSRLVRVNLPTHAAHGMPARILSRCRAEAPHGYHVVLVDAPFRINDFYLEADELIGVQS